MKFFELTLSLQTTCEWVQWLQQKAETFTIDVSSEIHTPREFKSQVVCIP